MDTLKMALALQDYRRGADFLMAGFCLDALMPWTCSDRVRQVRCWGADRQREIVNTYHQKGIRTDILLIVLAKKLKLIAGAMTMDQVKEIIRPSMPDLQAGMVKIRSPYHVEEEELVLWSLFSPTCLMRHEAKERALELFDRFRARWVDSPPEGPDARGKKKKENGRRQRDGE